MKIVNFSELAEREISLSSYKVGGVRDKTTGNLFIKGLNPNTKSKDLYEFFSKYGKILSCRVRYDNETGKCKGYGYVQFEMKESADKALDKNNNDILMEKKIETSPYICSKNRKTRYNNLYVKCIPKNFTNENLKELFTKYGKIISAVVIKDKAEDKENKGFGFVCFETPQEANAAEKEMKDVNVEGKKLFICEALPREVHKKKLKEERLQAFKDCNLYVKELPEDINDDKLKEAFSKFGNVLSVRVMLDKKLDPTTGTTIRKSRGYGFVCFSSKEEAANVKQLAQNTNILGKQLYVNIAQAKIERVARAHHQQFMPFPQYPPMGMYPMPPPFYYNPYPRQRGPRQVYILKS